MRRTLVLLVAWSALARADEGEDAHVNLSGWLDFGFFAAGGDGSGVRRDLGHVHFPEYRDDIPGDWVLMGDPLSTAINSRGEPADVGASRSTPDPIDSSGDATFLVNAVGAQLSIGIGDTLALWSEVQVLPRETDAIDVRLAYAAWMPELPFELELDAGKVDSVLGIEYRKQNARDRIGISPSLVCRYTCGTPLGVEARARWLDKKLMTNLALTNGSSFVDLFPFQSEVDRNDAKTVSARVSWTFPVGRRLEVGASGAAGAQDLQADDFLVQWHVGLDLALDVCDWLVRAEVVHGKAPGKSDDASMVLCDLAPCLDYYAAYALGAWQATNVFLPYLRVDWRRANHRDGNQFIYIGDEARLTAGVHAEIGLNVIVKAEYTYNRELGRIPQFPDDVFTSSLVVTW